jgi:hypothetical protein
LELKLYVKIGVGKLKGYNGMKMWINYGKTGKKCKCNLHVEKRYTVEKTFNLLNLFTEKSFNGREVKA